MHKQRPSESLPVFSDDKFYQHLCDNPINQGVGTPTHPASMNAISRGTGWLAGDQTWLNLHRANARRELNNTAHTQRNVLVSFCHCSSHTQTHWVSILCVFLTEYEIRYHNGCILFFHGLYNLKLRSVLARGKRNKTILSITLLYFSQLIYGKVLYNESIQ